MTEYAMAHPYLTFIIAIAFSVAMSYWGVRR